MVPEKSNTQSRPKLAKLMRHLIQSEGNLVKSLKSVEHSINIIQ